MLLRPGGLSRAEIAERLGGIGVAPAQRKMRTQQLWHLDSTGVDGKLIAQGQVRLANLDQPIPPETLEKFVGSYRTT